MRRRGSGTIGAVWVKAVAPTPTAPTEKRLASLMPDQSKKPSVCNTMEFSIFPVSPTHPHALIVDQRLPWCDPLQSESRDSRCG